MQSSSLVPDAATTTSSTAAISINTKKKKRRRSKKGSNTSDNAQDNDNIKTSILNSNLSLKKHTQLKKLTKLTPWYDIHELTSVGNGLLLALKLFPSPSSSPSIATPPFSSSTSQQLQEQPIQSPVAAGLTNEEYTQLKLALHTVAIWRGKSDKGGRLSHAIDITAGLASVLLMDAERSSSAMSASFTNNVSSGVGVTSSSTTILPTIYQIRSTYSTLLLRSVNGLADTYRHSSKSNTLSVSYCCKLAGLPLWIVDIRHDASHNDLPTLGVCRIGALESLRFWSGRYWKLLEGKCYGSGDTSSSNVGSSGVGEDVMKEKGVYTLAVDCLVRYQNAVVNEVCDQNKKKKGEKRKAVMGSTLQGLEAVAGEDNDSTSIPSNAKDSKSNSGEKQVTSQTSTSTGSANPWSILDDDKPKKKRKKSKKDDNDDPTISMENKSVTPANSQEDTAQTTAAAPPPTSSNCAAEFIRTIPIDIAYSTAIQFLVWGRTGVNTTEENTNVNGPALLTFLSVLDSQSSSSDSSNTQSSSSSSQAFDTSFEKLRIMYEPLIIAITNVYPGFITALFVHLIDSILCLDKARRQSHQGEGDLDMKQLDRHTQYILRWIRHILSRAFHMHFDKSVAIFTPEIDQSVVIKPPLQTETVENTVSEHTADEKIFTPQPIDLKKKGRKKWTQAQLEYMQRPLDYSSLREMGFPLNSVCDRILSHHQELESGTSVIELKQHLEDIIGNERVVFMDIYGQQGVASEDSDHDISGSTSSTPMLDDSKPPQEVPTKEENNVLSLEDMEAMLDKEKDTAKKDNHDAHVSSDEPENTLPSRVVPWTLCKSWDACAIGSLPGHLA